jgi:hypothetical protein
MKKLEKILGYQPGKELKKMILTAARDEGLPVEEVAARFQMPEMFIDFDGNGKVQTDQGIMTPEEYQTLNPYKKIVIIKRRKYD